MSDPTQWAQRLGMAASTLFPTGSQGPGDHYAMLDGRRASFACSLVNTVDLPADVSRNWQWSADLAHHVFISDGEVQVRSGRDPLVRRFSRSSVESQLEEFLNFLDSSRHPALPDVVPFLVQEFQSVWANGGYDEGERALAAFLLVLHAAGEPDVGVLNSAQWREAVASDLGIDGTGVANSANSLVEDARRMQDRAPFGLKLVSPLVLRHVAGRLFQEAHAVLESVQFALFGRASITTTPIYSPAAAYFTPVPIARLLAEWAINQRSPLPQEVVIADFACGSGVFLTESLRVLERSDFSGTVHLIGRDKSAQAIIMAKVAVRGVQREIRTMEIHSDVAQADALESEWSKADIVLMNPPFRSWERMPEREREWVYETTNRTGRPDLSVGFIERGIGALNPSGVLATLLPAGVLASETSSKWRNQMLQRATPSLIAVLGEHGLFQHALVNVGILSLQCNGMGRPQRPIHVGWSSAETGSAAKVIRAIRRCITAPAEVASIQPAVDWSLTKASVAMWSKRSSWLPGASALGSVLERLQSTVATTVENLFNVRQGIRTGAKDVFVQPGDVVNGLPHTERKYFREAVDAASFVDGDIRPTNYLFVPDQTWQSESDVQRAVPQFFAKYLEPRREPLTRRKRKSQDNRRWWELTWPRFWAFDGRPRLVSKRFGLYPAFARDFQGSLAVVQANAWIPTATMTPGRAGTDSIRELLTAYWWVLNSRVAVALFREYCPNVAGGQLDLEHKYVKHVPLPNLALRLDEDPALQVLATSIRTRSGDKLPRLGDRDHFAAAVFGTDISDWNLAGLE